MCNYIESIDIGQKKKKICDREVEKKGIEERNKKDERRKKGREEQRKGRIKE